MVITDFNCSGAPPQLFINFLMYHKATWNISRSCFELICKCNIERTSSCHIVLATEENFKILVYSVSETKRLLKSS